MEQTPSIPPVVQAAQEAAPAVAALLAPAPLKSVTLRDGRTLSLMRRATVRDLLHARRVVRGADGQVDEGALEFAVLASCCQINGTLARLEDLMDVELAEIMRLAEDAGADFSGSPAAN